MRKTILITVLVCAGFFLLDGKMVNAAMDESAAFRKQQFDESMKEVCNRVMLAIYNDILSVKGDYDNLVDFDQHVLSKNQYGIYTIEYQHKILQGIRSGEFLNFGVTIVKPEDVNFNNYGQQAFNFGFPLLDVKFAGYQRTNRKWMKFSIQEVVQRNGDPLLEEQKKHLPLKLSLETDKKEYKIREDIQITVILENVSNKNLWIKSLDNETLYFLYANTKWGALSISEEKEKRKRKFILTPGQKVYKNFVGSGSSVPHEFEIYCSYAVTFKGVKPSSVIKVKVIE